MANFKLALIQMRIDKPTHLGDIVILGAGVIGVSTAYWLAKAGFGVTVIDRHHQPARETSFANGGQISVCHAQPWAHPKAVAQVIKWLANPEAPLLFKPKADLHQWRWLLQWLYQCLPYRNKYNLKYIVHAALHSRTCLQQLRTEHRLDYQHRKQGILHFYCNQTEYKRACKTSQLMRQLGCERNVLTPAQTLALEPALQGIEDKLVGGTYTADDESGNAYLFCQELKPICENLGVKFRLGENIVQLERNGQRIHATVANSIQTEQITATDMIVCMGAWSTPILRNIGIYPNMYPAKGYSITLPLTHHKHAPQLSLIDDEHKLVFSRLGNNLRVAGTAELNGYSTEINVVRCHAMLKRVNSLFPGISENNNDLNYWAGLRPATPSGIPYIGKTKYPNLWLNTGHGPLGWTLACGSGQRLAAMINANRSALM